MIKNRNLISILIVVTALLIIACQNRESTQAVSEPEATAVHPVFTTTHSVDEKEVILQKINQLVEDYNTIIENEKKIGTYNGLLFTDKSLLNVYKAELLVQTGITSLNEQYYVLTLSEYRTSPTPNPLAQNGDSDKLLAEYLKWSEQEAIHGSIVRVYSTGDGLYYNILIGDSYVKMKQWEFQIATVQANLANLSQQSIETDIVEIQRLENGSIPIFIDIGILPYYRSDVNLSTYETALNFYILNSQTHQVIEISPKQLPNAIAGKPQELESKAMELIALISPEVTIETLTSAHGEKIGTYFFRWEDRTKPFLDDGRSYPFIQVGFNGNGELLGFYNTLSLAR